MTDTGATVLAPRDFFDLTDVEETALFDGCRYVWQALTRLADYLAARARRDLRGQIASTATIEGEVLVAPGAIIEPSARVLGPAIIGPGCRVGHAALLRGGVVMGAGATVGHATEVKESILLPDAHAPHFNYVGNSIIGRGANLGAGAICSNFKLTKTPVVVRIGDAEYDTGLLKFGAVVGDGSQVGCNTVLNPGTLLGKNVLTYPGTSLRGYFRDNAIVKLSQEVATAQRR